MYRESKPSNQNALPIDKAHLFNVKAREWVENNPLDWEKYMMIAKAESRFGELSPNYPIAILRHRHHVKVKTDYAPYLARIAYEQDQSLRFRLRKSRADGFCKVKL